MSQVAVRFGLLICVCLPLTSWSPAEAQGTFGPDDPIASIDGSPIFLGELNLLLTERLRAKDLNKVDMNVQRASAGLLVKRHLALLSLKQQGGEALQRILDRNWQQFESELARQGTAIDEYAKRRKSDKSSVRATRDFEAAGQAI